MRAVVLLAICLVSLGYAHAEEAGLKPVRALLVPRTEAQLSSQVSARITAIAVDLGDRFKKGDTLVQFDCQIEQAHRQKARAELDAATITHQSKQKLRKLASVSQLELALAKVNVQQARAELSAIDARLAMCSIKAPFAGRVVARNAHAFETVRQGDELIEILDDGELYADLFVPSGWVRWLKQGAEFEINIVETGKSYAAQVERIGARIDPVSRTVAVKGKLLSQSPELLAGMSGQATFRQAAQ
jgi:RND family efflux transporter MFP subunit